MPSIFDKLNLKAQAEIVVIDAPASFEPDLAALPGVAIVRDLGRARSIRFALAFATKQAEVDRLTAALTARAEGDAILWFAYPKGSSRNHRCDFNRDTGFRALRDAGFDSVRMVAIDADWSALRFRRVEFIKPARR